MRKLMLLFVLLLAFTTGCSRTFVVTNSEKLETNHLLVSSYTDQGIDVKETKNWTLGNTSGMNSYVYVEDDKAIKNVPKAPSLVPDLIVNFPFNSTSMHPESTANLASFIGELSIDKKLKLIGYTDSVGSEDVNFKLSIKRALAVKKVILEHKGLSIEVEGKGMNLPIANNETEAGRQLNRRVEVYLNE